MDATIFSWLIGGFCVLMNLAVTTILTILIKRWFSQRDKDRERREAEHDRLAKLEKEKEQAQLQKLMDSRCDLQINTIRNEFIPVMQTIAPLKDGVCAGLRDDLLNNYWRCRDWQKHRTDWDTQNMEDLYKSYKALGGNSFIDHLMEEFYHIPLQ